MSYSVNMLFTRNILPWSPQSGFQEFATSLKIKQNKKNQNDLFFVSLFMKIPQISSYCERVRPSETRRCDEAADYRAARRYVYAKKISETLKSVE